MLAEPRVRRSDVWLLGLTLGLRGRCAAADSLTAVATSLLLFLPSPPRAGDDEVVFEGKKGRL